MVSSQPHRSGLRRRGDMRRPLGCDSVGRGALRLGRMSWPPAERGSSSSASRFAGAPLKFTLAPSWTRSRERLRSAHSLSKSFPASSRMRSDPERVGNEEKGSQQSAVVAREGRLHGYPKARYRAARSRGAVRSAEETSYRCIWSYGPMIHGFSYFTVLSLCVHHVNSRFAPSCLTRSCIIGITSLLYSFRTDDTAPATSTVFSSRCVHRERDSMSNSR